MPNGLMQKENPLHAEVVEDGAARGHEKRLDRYSTAKARQKQLTDFIIKQNHGSDNPSYQKELRALVECGSFLIFRHYLKPDVFKLRGGCTCKKHLLCALCAIRRAARSIAVATEKLDHVLQFGDYDAFFVTLTVKNGPDLAERFEHLISGYKALLQKRRNSRKKKPLTDTCYRIVEGAFAAYEVTYNNKDLEYHPHLHSVVLIPRGLLRTTDCEVKKKTVQVPLQFWKQLSEEWQSITGDSFIVDVRKIDSKEDTIQALVECFKYALKMQNLDPEIQLHCYDVLKGRRLHTSFGCLYGLKLEDNTNDELLAEDLEYIDMLYKYSEGFGYQLMPSTCLSDNLVFKITTGHSLD